MRVALCRAGLIVLLIAAGASGEAIRLFDGPAPGMPPETPDIEESDDRRSRRVSVPTITPVLPESSMASGWGVVICPGGGFNVLMTDIEGMQIAARLNEAGIAAFVLRYRTRQFVEPEPFDAPQAAGLDGIRAMKLVRSRASEFRIDPDRLGIMGFSAGGNVAMNVAFADAPGVPDHPDLVERESARPAFVVGVYTRMKSFVDRIDPRTPPMFLAAAGDDRDRADDQIPAYLALRRAGVPVELHLFERGGHGFGPGEPGASVSRWLDQCIAWITRDRAR
jgi:acetyl esterase/lipase